MSQVNYREYAIMKFVWPIARSILVEYSYPQIGTLACSVLRPCVWHRARAVWVVSRSLAKDGRNTPFDREVDSGLLASWAC